MPPAHVGFSIQGCVRRWCPDSTKPVAIGVHFFFIPGSQAGVADRAIKRRLNGPCLMPSADAFRRVVGGVIKKSGVPSRRFPKQDVCRAWLKVLPAGWCLNTNDSAVHRVTGELLIPLHFRPPALTEVCHILTLSIGQT